MKVFVVLAIASMVLLAQAGRTRMRDTETGTGEYTWSGTENGTWSGTENGTWTYSGSGPEKRQEDGKCFLILATCNLDHMIVSRHFKGEGIL